MPLSGEGYVKGRRGFVVDKAVSGAGSWWNKVQMGRYRGVDKVVAGDVMTGSGLWAGVCGGTCGWWRGKRRKMMGLLL